MQGELLEALKRVDILRDLDRNLLSRVADVLDLRDVSSGTFVVEHESPGRDVFFVLIGSLRVTVFSVDGKEVAFRDLHAGETFGELAAIDGDPRSANVVARTNVRLAVASPDVYRKLMETHPAVMWASMRKLSGLVRSLSERVYDFATPVPVRVCTALVRLARANMIDHRSARLSPAPTHADIASRVNTHREAVSRTFSALRQAGIIVTRGRELLVIDVERLAAYARDHSPDIVPRHRRTI